MKYNKCKQQQQQQNSKERQPSWCITEVHRVVAAPEGKKTTFNFNFIFYGNGMCIADIQLI